MPPSGYRDGSAAIVGAPLRLPTKRNGNTRPSICREPRIPLPGNGSPTFTARILYSRFAGQKSRRPRDSRRAASSAPAEPRDRTDVG